MLKFSGTEICNFGSNCQFIMRISDLSINILKSYVMGENGIFPRLTGQQIIELFNYVGIQDLYHGGMPGGLTRKEYTQRKMMDINGTKELKNLFEIVVDARRVIGVANFDREAAIQAVNEILVHDGFRYEKVNGAYKITGADLSDEIAIEIHFEEIRKQIIEQIQQAKFLIWVAVAWFTDIHLLRLLYTKKKEGLNIQIVILDDDVNKKIGVNFQEHFEAHLLKPDSAYGNIMHHKFCIIDLKTVIHGSYNWTVRAQYNKETITIDSGREIAEKFASEFISLKK